MTRHEIEALIEDKVSKGEMGCGLYDAGLQYVLVGLEGDGVTFRWFDSAPDLADHIDL